MKGLRYATENSVNSSGIKFRELLNGKSDVLLRITLLYNLKNILRKLWFISEIIFADVEEMVK
jgi:hypothetical protein